MMKFTLNSIAKKLSFLLVLLLVGCEMPANYDGSRTHYSSPYAGARNPSRVAHANQTVVIYLVGLAGTGKYTIAKQISKRGYKVVDNHLINNPIFSLIGDVRKAPDNATQRINDIRNIVFDYMKDDHYSNYVLTNQLLEDGYHHSIYNNVKNTAYKRGSIFVPVRLVVSKKERAKRIVNPDRAKRFKTTNVDEVRYSGKMLHVSHENLLELDVTNLTPEQAATKILQHVNKIKKDG